jgi:cellulose synthase/poly-beta-1,6-N-acetylglucosamine synthase-like glycosyltransferase
MIAQLVQLSNTLLFLYYLSCNLIYLRLLIAAIKASIDHNRRRKTAGFDRVRHSPLTPPISLLVPAHNEEASIVESVRSLLALDYPDCEVIVTNDGSKDHTLAELTEHFHLVLSDCAYFPEIETKRVKGIYLSRSHRRLIVLDKEAAGSKADAINAALNMASKPYVCVVDADAVLESDALLRIMAPVSNDPDRVVAAGGIVRVINGSRVRDGAIREVRLPWGFLEMTQVEEYLRAFLIGREGWNYFNMLLIISGAFGVFRTDICKQIGGFRRGAIGEDFDVVVRMHRFLREQKKEYRIQFVADPVCWTEVPSTLRSLGNQRARWHKGLIDSLWHNRRMLFNPKYGRIGCVAIPYHWLFELIAPVLEFLGWVSIIGAACLGVLSREFFMQFLLFGYVFSTLISIGSVLIEEMTYRRYNNWRDLGFLICFCFLEHFPYRQIHTLWRLRGIWEFLRGNHIWTPIERVGFGDSPRAAPADVK